MFGQDFTSNKLKKITPPREQLRSSILQPILLALTGIALAAAIIVSQLSSVVDGSVTVAISAVIIFAALTWFARKGYTSISARLVVIMVVVIIAYSTIPFRGIHGKQTMLFALAIMLAFLLAGQKWGAWVAVFVIAWLSFLYGLAIFDLPLAAHWSDSNDPSIDFIITLTAIFSCIAVMRLADKQMGETVVAMLDNADKLEAEIERRVQAELELRTSNAQFSLLVDNVDALVWLGCADTLQASYVSPAYRSMMETEDVSLAYRPDALVNQLHPDDRPIYLEKIRALVAEEINTFDLECRIITAESNEKWILARNWLVDPTADDQSRPTLAGIAIDITDRVAQREALQESQTLLKLVIDSIPAHISYIDRDLRVRFINRSVTDLRGTHIQELYQPENYARIKDRIARAMAGEQQSFTHQLRRFDGSMRDLELQYIPCLVNGQIQGIFTLSWDVTDQLQTQRVLQQTQKLESLGVLAGGIAHDFNNLLVAILGQSSIAQVKLEASHPAKPHIAKTVSAAERASSLTQQMLAYSGRGQFEIRPISINNLLEQNLSLFQASTDKNIVVQTNLAAQLPPVYADSAQLQQVVMNLIINASQAIGKKHGLLTLTTTLVQTMPTQEQEKYTQLTNIPLGEAPYVRIDIADNGAGIPPETITRIFDPFFTTKSNGSGLGLAAVLGIIRGHNGGLIVESEVGIGTTFRLLFPCGQKPITPRLDIMTMQDEKMVSAEIEQHVLIIDDEPAIGESIVDLLEAEGIEAVFKDNGRDGIAHYRTHQEEIGLVLVDQSMPNMDGVQVFHALRNLNPAAEVILSSGYTQKDISAQFECDDITDFLQKPYDSDTLIQKVRAHL